MLPIRRDNVAFGECDNFEEVQKHINDLYRIARTQNTLIEKIMYPKKKREPTIVERAKRLLLWFAVLAICITSAASASVPWNWEYGTNPDLLDAFMRNPQFKNIEMDTITLANGATFANSTNGAFTFAEAGEDLIWTFTGNTVTVTSSLGVVLFDFALVVPKSDQFLFDPVASAVGTVEGTVYYDSDVDKLYLRNTSAWVDLTATTTSTMDDIYNNSAAALGVTVDVNPIIWTAPNANDKVVMSFVQADTATTKAITITNAGTGNTIDIEGMAAGKDIEGTGDTWNITGAGAATFVSGAIPTLTSTTITLSNGATIANTTDTEIIFGENLEDLSIDFGSDAIALKTTTGVATFDFGDVDALAGIESVTFDAVAATITLPSNGAADDLTIAITGTTDSSLILSSTGTAEDALQISTTNGGINITNNGAAAGEDIDLSSTAASINLTAAEGVTDAIVLTASTALGGIDITSNADIDITTTGVSGEDISITNTGGSIAISATESATDAVVIQSTVGGVQILASGAADTEDILMTATGSSIFITATQGVEDAIVLNASTAAGGIDITSNADIDMTTTGASGEDISITNTGGSIAISSTESAVDSVVIQSTIGGVQILAAGAADTEDILLTATGSSIFLTSTQGVTDAIKLNASDAAGGISVAYGTGNLGIVGTGVSADFTLDADLFSIDGVGLSNITVTSNAGSEDFTVALAGATDSSLILSSTGTAEDALQITTSAGGINITNGGAAGEDIDLLSSAASINLTATEGVTDAITIVAATAGGGIDITSQEDIDITTTGAADEDITITNTGGSVNINATENAAAAITMLTNGGSSETITITNTQGTGAAAVAVTATAGGITLSQATPGGVLVSTNAKTLRYKYFPIGYVSATEIRVGGGGSGNLCVGMTAGADEIGTTEGYATVDDAADYLRFSIPMPDTWIDTGTQTDLVLTFDILEVAAETVNINVLIFERGNASAIVTDTIVVTDGAGRAFVPLVTNPTGIGNDADIDGDDTLIIQLRPAADADDFKIYGMRLTYRVGLQATQ